MLSAVVARLLVTLVTVHLPDYNAPKFLSPTAQVDFKMPTWNQIQAQLRHPNNPVVFLDISVGSIVSVVNVNL